MDEWEASSIFVLIRKAFEENHKKRERLVSHRVLLKNTQTKINKRVPAFQLKKDIS